MIGARELHLSEIHEDLAELRHVTDSSDLKICHVEFAITEESALINVFSQLRPVARQACHKTVTFLLNPCTQMTSLRRGRSSDDDGKLFGLFACGSDDFEVRGSLSLDGTAADGI